jgi:hypothetical protein
MEERIKNILERMCKNAFASGWEGGINWISSSVDKKISIESAWKQFLEKEFNDD